MPELPEVETIRRGLERTLISKTIKHVELREKRSCTVPGNELSAAITNAKITKIQRRGKLLIVELSNDISLLIHLRMTGQLIFKAKEQNKVKTPDFGGGYPNQSFVNELPDKTTRIIITLSDDSHLYFNDQRKFGYIKPVKTSEVGKDSFVSSLGPEPLEENFTAQDFAACLPGKSKRSIKSVLLDQTIIAGVGNIYADESLFISRIKPDRLVSSLTGNEIDKLHLAIRTCMQQSIADGGSTMKDYVDSEGLRGEYLDLHAYVFNRAGHPCRICGTDIRKVKVAGRGTHFCHNCQK